jgi:hypothetical protein
VEPRRPEKFVLPSADDLGEQLKKLIAKCKSHFADPAVTELTWTASKAK